VFWFRSKHETDRGAFVRNGQIFFRQQEEREIMTVAEVPLKGAHNIENVLGAICAAALIGCSADSIRDAVRSFKAVEHRLEFVASIRGVDYYNDSKATNVDATIKALESFAGNIHLILGGKDKGSDYTVLNELLRKRVKAVYTIGAAAEKIQSHIQGATTIVPAGTIQAAVNQAAASAQTGDVVLLAPACASFDQFKSYEHRGRVFKQLVLALR
jgi:UDP-N-acetylmuramoylalanine--D-glutamate ligase